MTTEAKESPESQEAKPYNGLKAAGQEVARRLKKPMSQITFWIYLALAVIGLGGLAIWVELWRHFHPTITKADPHSSLDSLKLALATVFPAVVGASALELVLNEDKMARNLGLVFLSMCALLAVYLLGFGNPSDEIAIALGALGCVGAIFVWWIASGLDDIFQDRPGPGDAVGGDPTRDLASRATSIRT